VLAALCAFGGGCADLGDAAVGARASAQVAQRGRALRERDLGRRWAGRTREELQREWGEPAFMLNVPGDRRPSSYVMVFVDRDARGGCIDAFVVLDGDGADDGRIWTYICR
jgi:hypothetical protein